jgi:tetratricopeptide (TPR) repeat protein
LQSYRLAQQHGESGDTVVRLHRILTALGKQDDARRLEENWLKKSPSDAAFLRYSADLAMTRGNVALASDLYQKVLSKNPENVDVLNNSANALWQLNQRAEALRRAEKAYAMAPSDADVLDTFGWMLAESGQTGRSIPLLQRAAALRPGDPLLRYHLGRALLADKQQDAAKSALEEALRLGDFPGSEEARRLLKAL